MIQGRRRRRRPAKMRTGAGPPSSRRRADLVQALERPEAERQPLRPRAYPEEARDWAVVALLFDAQVREGVLACRWGG